MSEPQLDVVREAFFLSSPEGGQRFCLFSRPAAGDARGALLYVPPFAEELNKSRRMAAHAAARLAAAGWAVLQIDLLGCGDSSGEFADADWQAWLADIDLALGCLQERGYERIVLWGLRAGVLLLSNWLHDRGSFFPLLLWQPVLNGKQHLNQFLRIKGIGGMLDEQDAKTAMAAMRADIEAGTVVEVAGYQLSPGLIAGLEQSKFVLPPEYHFPVRVLEVGSGDPVRSSPAVLAMAERSTVLGADLKVCAVAGSSFWQTQEIEMCEALLAATVEVMDEIDGHLRAGAAV